MLYRAPDVAVQPSVELHRWKIFQTPEGTCHFCGTLITGEHDGRVSSKICYFDAEKLEGVTRSGRIYKLVGESSTHPDAMYVMAQWLRFNGIDPDLVTFVEPADVKTGP